MGNDHSVSELGLDQSEDSFQLSSTTKLKTKRTVTSRVDCLLETVFQSQGRRNVPEGKRKDLERGLQQGTSGRFTTRTEDLCTVQQKAIVHCPLVCSWGKLNNKLLIRLVSSKHSQRHGVQIQILELGAVRGVNWFRYIIKLHGKHHHCVVG